MKDKESSVFDQLKELVNEFPVQSGVYLMKNEAQKIIYVGKAAVLNNRVRQYFQKSRTRDAKTEAKTTPKSDDGAEQRRRDNVGRHPEQGGTGGGLANRAGPREPRHLRDLHAVPA